MNNNKTSIVDTLKNAFLYKEEELDNYDDDLEESDSLIQEDKIEDKPKKKKSIFSVMKKEEKFDNGEDDDLSYNISTVIVTPKSFKEAVKIVKHIEHNKLITVNFENIDKYTMQRILDFLSGAMEMKNAAYAQISRTVYTIVPEKLKVLYEGDQKEQTKIISIEREEK